MKSNVARVGNRTESNEVIKVSERRCRKSLRSREKGSKEELRVVCCTGVVEGKRGLNKRCVCVCVGGVRWE